MNEKLTSALEALHAEAAALRKAAPDSGWHTMSVTYRLKDGMVVLFDDLCIRRADAPAHGFISDVKVSHPGDPGYVPYGLQFTPPTEPYPAE
jgi:hypothetical protein